MAHGVKSAMVGATVTAMTAIHVVATPASASADSDGTLTVQVVKYPTPAFGVQLVELVKGTPPNDMDITGPAANERDLGGGQASHTYEIRPGRQPATAAAIYEVEQDGRHLGTFRIDFKLGPAGDSNSLSVTCNEQDSPVDCWAFENPFIVRIYAKTPANNT